MSMASDGFFTGFVIATAIACIGGMIYGERKRPDRLHPPTPVRVLSKSEALISGRYQLSLSFGAGGFSDTIYVDRFIYDRSSHWSCICVRYNVDRGDWWYVGPSTRCEP